MKINITKAHATQNHFLIIENQNPKLNQKEFIKKICSTKKHERIDGVLILSKKDQWENYFKSIDFKMDYYNNDGSWETMCANGARCAALYMFNKYGKKKMNFEAGDGNHTAEILNNSSVKLSMIKPKYCSDELSIEKTKGFHVDSGATHFVVEYPAIENQKVKELGKKIRHNKEFQPRGINVNFYEVMNKNEISVKTYEKGIENLMMSCASGSVASVFHLAKNKIIKSPVKVNVPGGDFLVDFSNDWNVVNIIGSAEIEQNYNISI